MANIQIDMTGVKSMTFEALPKGKYDVAIFNVEYKEGKAAPYLAVTYKVQEGPFAGRQVFDNVSFSPKALFKLKGLLAVVMPEIDTNGKLSFDPDDLVGRKCAITVIHEEYNGEPQAKVAKVTASTAVVDPFGAATQAMGNKDLTESDLPFLK
jgi:hypothetical protein